MIYPILISLAGILSSSSTEQPMLHPVKTETPAVVNFQDPPAAGRMRVVEFKAQDYCRAELKDFDFDAHFVVISADVYFSGANFVNIQKGAITSNSLKPIRALMDKCIPGTSVTFDNIKVKGPDNLIRTIDGVTYSLY